MKELKKKQSMMLCAAVALAGTTPCFADDGPAPGAAFEARQKLFERIQQARSQGMGITGYLQHFKSVEDQVKAGDPPDKINARIQAIQKALNDQLERAKVLKNQKPLPPQGSQITGGDPIDHSGPAGSGKSASGGPGGAGGGGGGGIGNKLKDKLDSLPDSVKEKIYEKIQEKTGGGGLPLGGPPAGGPPPGGPPGGPPPRPPQE